MTDVILEEKEKFLKWMNDNNEDGSRNEGIADMEKSIERYKKYLAGLDW